MLRPGRTCPVSYRYGPQALRAQPALELDTLWIAGGLYGNRYALESLLEAFDHDGGRKALVFNGDFHWFDAEPEEFAHINRTVLRFIATRGNVETELAAPETDAGCGCGYPDWGGQETVDRSNRILERLRGAACDLPALARLPMHRVAQVGGRRIAIVHGDADSLAGWNFSQEVLATEQGARSARAAFAAAGVDVFASIHTCRPVMQEFGDGRVLANNGAAGMPNFRRERYGLATRIALSPAPASVHGVREGEVFIDAVALHYDHDAWQRRFIELCPPGSDAHASYYDRILNGPDYHAEHR